MAAEFRFAGCEFFGKSLYIVDQRKRWKIPEKNLSVALGEQSAVEDREHSVINAGTDQASEPLLQKHHRSRKLVIKERILAEIAQILDLGFDQRIIGNGKRKFVDDHGNES